MMLKRYIAKFAIVVLVFSLGVLTVSVYPFKLSESNVTIEVSDNYYACGDCYIGLEVRGIIENNRTYANKILTV